MHSTFKHPLLVRLSLLILSVSAILFSSYYYYNTTVTPTDENVFVKPPSTLMFKQRNIKTAGDSLYGALIGKVDSARIYDKSFFIKAFNDSHNDSLKIVFYNSVYKKTIAVHIAKKDINFDSLQEIKSLVIITDVTKNGASERAGLQVGDLIYKINNLEFSNIFEADAILRSTPVGKAIAYDIYRNGEPIKFNVVIASFGIYVPELIAWIIGIISLIVGGVFGFYRGHHKGIFFPALIFICAGINLGIDLTKSAEYNSAFYIALAVIQQSANIISIALILSLFKYFPIENEWLKRKKYLTYAYYALAYSIILTNIIVVIFFRESDLNINLPISITFSIFITGLFIILSIKNKKENNYLASKTRPLYIISLLLATLIVLVTFNPI